jgi:hypothetical protein
MYLPLLNPLSNPPAIFTLLVGTAASLLVALWFLWLSAREPPVAGHSGKPRPVLFWATALPIGVGVVFMIILLLLSLVFTVLSAIVVFRSGGLFLG